MNLLLLDPDDLRDGRARLRGRSAAHLRTVLRVGPGDTVRLGVLRGPRGTGRVVALEAGGSDAPVTLEVTLDQPPSPRPRVDLLLAVPRPKVLRRVLRALGSIGIGRLDLVNTWRVEKSYLQSPALAPEALARELRLGAEQGATTWIPDVAVHPLLMPFLDDAWPTAASAPRGADNTPRGADSAPREHTTTPLLRLTAHPRALLPLAQAVREVFSPRPGDPPTDEPAPSPRVVVAVGPEGGFIEREVETLSARGFVPVHLGAPVLSVQSVLPWLLGQLDLLLEPGRAGA